MAVSSWVIAFYKVIASRISLFEIRILSSFTPLGLNYGAVPQSWDGQSETVKEVREVEGILWMAAPKKKTSAAKKRLRNRFKVLRNRTDIEVCVVCGKHKLMDHLCGHCVEKTRQATREYRREEKEHEKHWPIPEVLKKFRLY